MQVTIELTQKEYIQIGRRVKIAIVTKPTDVANISVVDQILYRLCLAVSEKARETRKEESKEESHEQPTA